MVQGHSGNVLIQTFKKVGILVKNVPMFLRHSSNLVFEYVTNRYEEVLAVQKKVCVSQSQIVKILTFGTDFTFRIMVVLSEEQERKRIANLQAPQKFAEVVKTVECAHDFQVEEIESSMSALLTYGNTLAVQALLETPEKIAVAIAVFGKLNLADSGMIRVLLTHGGWSVIQAFLQAPQEIATAMQTMASAHGFEES